MTLLIAIVGIVLLVILLLMFMYFADMLLSLIRSRGVPYVPSFDRDLALMDTSLGLDAGKTLVDLGCGDGKALRYLVKNYTLRQGVGYEISRHAVLLGRFLNWKHDSKNIQIIHGSLYTADLKKYDYIYCYLMPFVMKDIETWLQKNIGKNTIVIVNSFKFPHRKPYKIIKDTRGKEKIFLYRKQETK